MRENFCSIFTLAMLFIEWKRWQKVCKINVIEYLTGNIYNYENTWKNNWSGVYYLNMKYET